MEKYLGKWTQSKAENLDEFLAAKGMPWIVRKIVATASLHMEISEKDGEYRLYQWTAMKNMMDITFKLDTEQEFTRMDGKKGKTKFFIDDNGLLVQQMIMPDEETEDVLREITEEGEIVQSMKAGSVLCKRWFKKDSN